MAAAALALIALGALDLARRPPARVLLTAGHGWDYVRVAERAMAQAQQRIWVGLFVARLPDEEDPAHPVSVLLQALVDAHHRGIDVRVCLDRSMTWDEPEVPDTKHEAPAAWLRQRGVRVFEDEIDRTTHVKIVLVDDDTVILGSHNWTGAALMRNREVSVLIRDADLAQQLAREVFGFIPGWTDAEFPPAAP